MTELNLPPPFIGREYELNFLKEKVHCAMQTVPQGSTLFIAGESGVGKTRLVEEIINYAEQNGFQTFRGQCHLNMAPFMPITEMLREAGLEHLILYTSPPRLESIFLYTNTGKLVCKLERDIEHRTQNIESKIKDYITMKDDTQRILTKELGEFTLVAARGTLTTLCCIIKGRENEFLIDDCQNLLEKLEKNYSEQLETISDDDSESVSIMRGEKYLIPDTGDEKIYTILQKNVSKRISSPVRVLIISRKHPDKIRHNLTTQIEAYWLSRVDAPNAINPSNIESILNIIEEFLTTSGPNETFIVIDGLEYLITHTNFNRVVKLIYEVSDIITLKNSRLLISIDPRTLPNEQYAILSRNFKIIEKKEPVKLNEILQTLFATGKYEGIEYTDDAKIRQTNIFENVLRGIQRISESKPLLLFIDDLQWADTSSLALIHYLARNIRRLRILLLGTYRPEDMETKDDGTIHPLVSTMQIMNREELFEKIELKRFDEQYCEQLINYILGSNLEKEFISKIFKETEGNALFIIETLKYMYDEGLLSGEKSLSNLSNLSNLMIPSRIYDVIVRRIQTLAKEERDVLEPASVIGIEFTSSLLSKITELNKIQLLKLLNNIERVHHLIKSFKEKYRFEHSKIRDVLYSELNEELRSAYHEIIAKTLEEDYKRGNSEVLPTIFGHYQRTGNFEKMIEYGTLAGRYAKQKFANDEAIRFFKETLEAIKHEEESRDNSQLLTLKLTLWDELADVLELNGKYDESLKYLTTKISHTIVSQPIESSRAYRRCAEIYIKKSDYNNALDEISKGLVVVASQPATKESLLEKARLFSTKGFVYERKCDYDKAIEFQEKAKNVFEEFNEEKDVAGVLNRIGVAWFYKGEYEKALEVHHKSLSLKEQIGDLSGIAVSYNNIGVVYQDKGEYEKALEYHQKSLTLKEKIGDVRGIATSYNNISAIYQEIGEYEKSLEFNQKGLSLLEKIGDLRGVAASYNQIGNIYLVRGEYEKAVEFYQKSLTIKEKLGDLLGMAATYNNIGNTYRLQENYDNALQFYQKGIEICREIGNKSLMSCNLLGMADVYLEKKEISNCEKYLNEGETLSIEIGVKEFIAYAHAIRGKLQTSNTEFEKAIAMYDEIGKNDLDYYKTLYEYGRLKNDKEMLKKVYEYFKKIGNKVWAEKVKSALSV